MKLYFDIDTQIDFLFPAGALYVKGAEKLVPLIATLNRSAASSGAKVISTTCSHDEDDPEFKQWPPHCVSGTIGQAKPCSLLLEKRCVVPKQRTGLAIDAGQIILEKGELNLFSNPNTDALLQALAPNKESVECVVYGVVTEYCVMHCAMGLLDRGYKVSLVREAIQSLNDAAADRFLHDFAARSGAGFWREA
jgi:nicotinamidase/pyrazinamidase